MNYEHSTTIELVNYLKGLAPHTDTAALDELLAREIKLGDSDDTAKVEGGIRPLHAPRV